MVQGKNNPVIIVVLHELRSLYNVGSIIRTAAGFGVPNILTVGITPHPHQISDSRLPHIISRVEKELNKTALGAQNIVKIRHFDRFSSCAKYLRAKNYRLVAIEQADNSQPLQSLCASNKHPMALIFGNERQGLPPEVLESVDSIYEIPMPGEKKSFNVAISVAITLYHLQTFNLGI